MSEFIVHGIIGSPYMRAVLLALEEKGRTWRITPVRIGEHLSPAYLARHPFGRVPVVEHGDFQLYETQAVLRYVERLYPEPALIPADPRAAARMDQIMGINDWYVMTQIGGPIVFQRVIAPRFGMPGDEARVQGALPKAQVCLGELARLLGGQPFLAGEALSLADLMVAPQLSLLAQCAEGQALLEPHAALRAWLERMQARGSMQRTDWDHLAGAYQAA